MRGAFEQPLLVQIFRNYSFSPESRHICPFISASISIFFSWQDSYHPALGTSPPSPPASSPPHLPFDNTFKLHTFFWYTGMFLPLDNNLYKTIPILNLKIQYSGTTRWFTYLSFSWFWQSLFDNFVLTFIFIIPYLGPPDLRLRMSVTTGMNDSLQVNPELNKSQIINFSQQCDVWNLKAKVLLLRVRPGFPKNLRQYYVKVRHQLRGNEDFSSVLAQL